LALRQIGAAKAFVPNGAAFGIIPATWLRTFLFCGLSGMRRSVIQIYALAVCFTTLMCLVVSLGIGLYDGVRIAFPGFTLSGWQVYASNAHYVVFWPDKKDLPDEQITNLREAAHRDALAGERHGATQSLLFVSIILIIDIVVYMAHWRIARTCADPPPAATTL
jgi:hypothetical protein